MIISITTSKSATWPSTVTDLASTTVYRDTTQTLIKH